MTEVEKKGIGKAKTGLVVCAVLVVILAVSNVWSYTSLQNQVNQLRTDKTNLESQLDSLNTEYWDLYANHTHENWWHHYYEDLTVVLQTWLDGNITNYETQINSLNADIADLGDQIVNLNDVYWELYSNYTAENWWHYYYENQTAALQFQIETLTNEKNQLQTWLDGNISLLQTTIAEYQNYMATHGYTNDEYWDLYANYTHENWWHYYYKNKTEELEAPKLIKVDLRADDIRKVWPWDPDHHLHVYGEICNIGTDTAYNCKLRVVAYQGAVVAFDKYILLGTMYGETWTTVDENLYYSGDALTGWSITPEWTTAP